MSAVEFGRELSSDWSDAVSCVMMIMAELRLGCTVTDEDDVYCPSDGAVCTYVHSVVGDAP